MSTSRSLAIVALVLLPSYAMAEPGCVDAHARGRGVADRCKVDHGKPDVAPEPLVVLAVGDSICDGVLANGLATWAHRIDGVVERCVHGSSAADVLQRLPADIADVAPDVVVVNLGSAQHARCELRRFYGDLLRVVSAVQAYGATPVLLGVIPTCPAHKRPGWACDDAATADAIVELVAQASGAAYVDLWDFTAGAQCGPLYVDWIHPSAAGYDLLTPLVSEALP